MKIFKKRDKWWVDYSDPNGIRHRKPVGPSKREAEGELEKIRASILVGTYSADHENPKREKPVALTLENLWQEYSSGRAGVAPSTIKSEQVRMEKVIFAFFGKNTPLPALKPTCFAKFVRWRLEKTDKKGQGVSKSTVARDISVLRSMWNWAAKFLPEAVPPCPIPKNSELKLPYQSPPRIQFFSREDLDRILDEAKKSSPDRLYVAIALGAFGGLRRSEITNLRWVRIPAKPDSHSGGRRTAFR